MGCFDKLINQVGAKVANYGFKKDMKQNDEIVVLLTNGEQYLVQPETGGFRPFAGTIHVRERHIDVPGYKCLYNGVKAPYTTSYTEITWEE